MILSDAACAGRRAALHEPTNAAPAQPTNAPLGAAPPAPPEAAELPVLGWEPAVIVLPAEGRSAPLLVAAHGAGGDPAWECERWGHVARSRFVVLCPRGTPLRRGEAGSYYYADHRALEREVTAAVVAARAAYGARIAAGDGVYLGYSQGATMGALMLVEHGAEFPHLLLIEGGTGDWTLARATRYRSTGGRSVFFVCGTPPCAARARTSTEVLRRAGLRAEADSSAGAGHTELGAVGERAEKWLEALIVSAP